MTFVIGFASEHPLSFLSQPQVGVAFWPSSWASCSKWIRVGRDDVVFARRAKMNETRTQSKNMIDLCQIKKIIAYLSKLLAGGQFENPAKIFKIFIGFSMKNRENQKFSKIENRKIENRNSKIQKIFDENIDFPIFRFF